MLPKTLYVRFYKSFNFDYLRKAHPEAKQQPWELLGGLWYPHVRVPLHPRITTMVGANESGKSHLLTALEKAVSGKGIERSDFCRYSKFLTVEAGKWKWPEFGVEWCDLSERETKSLAQICDTSHEGIDSFRMFRRSPSEVVIHLPGRDPITPR